MKKTLLSAAAFAVVAVSAVSIAPTTSEAIPAFARQTGAACLSCHFQSFPALNSFGRAFKLGAFTDVGEQALIEDDNLSLPAVLNLGMVLRPAYVKVKDKLATAANGRAAVTTYWSVPTDSNILLAGRVGSNTGAFVEFAGGAGNFQLMNSFDFDTFKAGINIAGTSFGPTAALELTSVYGQHGGKLFGSDVSAIENIIVAPGGDTSIAAWASNGMFTIQVAAVVVGANVANNALGGPAAAGDPASVVNNSFVPMIAATYTGDIGAFNAVIEIGTMNGTQASATQAFNTVPATATKAGVKATWIAAQLQGDVGDSSLGIYADYATTKSSGVDGNLYATNLSGTALDTAKVDGYSIRAEIEPINKLLFGLGYGSVKYTPVTGTAIKTNISHFAVTYEVYQNMELTLSQTNKTDGQTAGAGGINQDSTRVELLAVF